MAIAKKVLEVPKKEASKIDPKIAFELLIKMKANGIIEYEIKSQTISKSQPRSELQTSSESQTRSKS